MILAKNCITNEQWPDHSVSPLNDMHLETDTRWHFHLSLSESHLRSQSCWMLTCSPLPATDQIKLAWWLCPTSCPCYPLPQLFCAVFGQLKPLDETVLVRIESPENFSDRGNTCLYFVSIWFVTRRSILGSVLLTKLAQRDLRRPKETWDRPGTDLRLTWDWPERKRRRLRALDKLYSDRRSNERRLAFIELLTEPKKIKWPQ